MPHAQPLEIIDVRPLGAELRSSVTSSLTKTPTLQLMRVVLQGGPALPKHSVAGAIGVSCLEGEALVTTPSRRSHLGAGRLVVLEGGERCTP